MVDLVSDDHRPFVHELNLHEHIELIHQDCVLRVVSWLQEGQNHLDEVSVDLILPGVVLLCFLGGLAKHVLIVLGNAEELLELLEEVVEEESRV